MTNSQKEWNYANSCLKVVCSGVDYSIANDLNKPIGKNILELLDEQKKEKENKQ